MSKAKTPKPIVENIFAKHVFTQDELLELSRELGRTCTQISKLESEKSAVTKDFAGRIETQEIKRDGLVDNVTSGYAMQPTDCIVILARRIARRITSSRTRTARRETLWSAGKCRPPTFN
jgi:hypothetical protein